MNAADQPFFRRPRFVIHRSIFDNFDLFYYHQMDGGRIAMPLPLTMEVRPQLDVIQPLPMMTLKADEVQGLMDELWSAGVRPTEGTGSAGSLAATERHLSDMRALVFKTGAPSK